MSEGNERNLESVAPETAENIQPEAKDTAQEAEPAVVPAEPVQEEKPAPDMDDRENAPALRDTETKPKRKKGKKKKKRSTRSVVIPLVIVLAVLLVILGVLAGFGLSRVRNDRAQEREEARRQEDVFASGFDDVDEAGDFDAFSEEITNENQQALEALSGEDGLVDEGASALVGEDELFLTDWESELDSEFFEDPVVVAEFGDGETLMSDEVLEAYSEQLSMYILSGYSEEEIAEELLDDVMQTLVTDRMLASHAREMGLYELSDEDRAEVEAEAQEFYEDYVAYYREYVVDTDGMSAVEAEKAAQEYLLEFEGVSYTSLVEEIGQEWWKEKLYDAITADVRVDDAAVRAAYEDLLEEQREDFAEYPEDYEFTQMNGEVIVYNLPGYRAVKVLQLDFDDDEAAIAVYTLIDEISDMDAKKDADLLAERIAELDACYAGPEARAQEALERLRGGADMDELIVSIGTDAGMDDAQQRAMGYYVSADSNLWSDSFIRAAMALKEVGEYSEPVRTEEGVCILQYLGEVPEGEVPLEDVRGELEAETLDAAQYDAYAAQVQAWLAEANPSYYPERMQ